MKKLTALLLALVMVLAMNASALAADPLATGTNALTTTKFDVKYEPEAGVGVAAKTFSYTVAPSNASIDGSNPAVYEGVGTMTVTSVSFTANDADETKEATITLPTGGTTTFPHAGIYRYSITQAAFTADEVDAGILNENGTGLAVVKYLDLYVNNNGEILSVVMTDAANTLDGVNPVADKTDNFANTFAKDGTTNPDPGDPGTPPNSGKHTITLDKTVTGSMGDTNEEFKFSIQVTDLTNSHILNGVKYSIDGTQNYEIGTEYTNVISLKHGESVDIIVPNDVQVDIKELTDAAEGYKITSTAPSGWNATPTTVTNLTTADIGFSGTLDNANQTAGVSYENNRDAISPTGVVLRIAPYAIMLGAGVVLFIILKSRKNKAVEEA